MNMLTKIFDQAVRNETKEYAEKARSFEKYGQWKMAAKYWALAGDNKKAIRARCKINAA